MRYDIAVEPVFSGQCHCRDCQRATGSGHATPIAWRFAARPDIITIMVGSLDDPGVFAPQMVLHAGRGFAWDRVDPELPSFDKLPPAMD